MPQWQAVSEVAKEPDFDDPTICGERKDSGCDFIVLIGLVLLIFFSGFLAGIGLR